MPGILDQHLMRADRTHAVVNAIAAASGLAFNVVERCGMHHRACRPAHRAGNCGDELRSLRGIWAKTADGLRTWCALGSVVSGHDQERVMGSLRSSMHKVNTAG